MFWALPSNVMGRGEPLDRRVFPRDDLLWADTCAYLAQMWLNPPRACVPHALVAISG